ncbi:hypothetical protein MK489_01235 [Myxococcota bacterium]|nr:hypothetical protein [Myxococcota bacterium]
MKPETVSHRLAQLRKSGLGLRERSASDIARVLAEVVDRWSSPESVWRQRLVSELTPLAGFNAGLMERGLEVGLSHWSGPALQDLVHRELANSQKTMVSGFQITAVLLAGSIPMPSLIGLVAPLLLRSPVLAKSAARDPVTPRLVAESIAEVDEQLGDCIDVVDFPGSDEACVRALLAADCVVASGSDDTVARVAELLHPYQRFVGYGHRTSVAVISEAATRGAALETTAAALSLDVCLWDQLGCLSPVAVFVVGSDADAKTRLAQALASALARAEERWPRGDVDGSTAATISHERSEAEMRSAAGRSVELWASTTTAWTVIAEEDPSLRPNPLHRFIRIHSVDDMSQLLSALEPLGPHLAAVALEGFDLNSDEWTTAVAKLGASRICPVGRMQAPPLNWHHDNRGVLTPLARFMDLELHTGKLS